MGEWGKSSETVGDGLRAASFIPRVYNEALTLEKLTMSSKQGGKAKPLKQPKAEKKEYDENDLVNLHQKDEKKAQQKGSCGGSGLKKSGKK